MRLTLVIASLKRGGAERVMSTLASAWSNQGKLVTLITLEAQEAPAYPLESAVRLIPLGSAGASKSFFQGLWRNFHRVRILRHAIRESRPDIVVSFMDSTNVLTILATRGMGKPLVISERIDPSLYHIDRPWRFLRRLLYRFADELVCQTAPALARFQAIARVRGRVIPNPIESPGFTRSGPSSKPAAQAGYTMAAMGRLVPQKGFDLLLRAFSKIAGREPDWTLLIYGEGPQREELEMLTEKLNLAGRVCFPGAVTNPFDRLREADLFVFSSRYEGFGMALAEAMACGLPVVSFDCPEGPRQIIQHNVDGLLVPAQDIDALADALEYLIRHEEERRRLATRAPDVCRRFNLENILEMWDQLFAALSPTSSQHVEHTKMA